MGNVIAQWTRFIHLSFHPSIVKELPLCALFRWTYDWNRSASVSDRIVILGEVSRSAMGGMVNGV